MICYAAYFLYSKPVLSRYGSITVSFYVMFFASFCVLPFGLMEARQIELSRDQWHRVALGGLHCPLPDDTDLPAQPLGVEAGLLQPGRGIHLLPAALCRRGCSAMLEGEQLTPRAAVAGLAIFSGLALVILAERRQHREIPLEAVGE